LAIERSARILFEGFAIVVSILLAFAIDAAWDLRGELAEEREALAGLRSDFLSSREQMDYVLRAHRSRADVFDSFQNATANDLVTLAQDSATDVYRQLYAPNTFNGVRGNADALISSGKLDVIRDRVLRERLVTFLNLDLDSAEELAEMRAASSAFLAATVRHGGPWNPGRGRASNSRLSQVSGADLARMRTDVEVMGRLRLAHHWSGIYLGELSALSGVIDEVLGLRDRSLE
jgi:hypothetical protein